MEFEQKKDDEVAAKYKVPKEIINIWQRRNKIPDEYCKEYYTEEFLTGDAKEVYKIAKALSHGKFRKAALARNAGMKYSRVMDISTVRRLSAAEIFSLKKVINESRNRIEDFLTATDKVSIITSKEEKILKEILKDDNLVFSNIFKQFRDLAWQLSGWKYEERTGIADESMNKIRSSFLVFLTETSIS